MAKRNLLLLAAFFLYASPSVGAADVHIFTETYPPYNYRMEDGTVAGDATALVRKVMDESGLSYNITVAPWARAVKFTEQADNALIYSIARIPLREQHFQWLVPLAHDKYYLFARREDRRKVTLEDLKAGRFSVICVFGDISCILLQQGGVPRTGILESRELDQPGTLKMVEIGRVDLFPGSIINYRSEPWHTGAWEGRFKPVYDLKVGLTLYLAGGANTRPEIASAIRLAYDRLLARGDFKTMHPDVPALDK